ncbi:MAG TPA: zinc ribbon domain-containing protein [Terriglobia bacterium]|nr:zinc ribbon domain-containing protein [Terriglobia bacterium]
MAFCAQCGAQVSDGAAFCAKCRARAVAPAPPAPNQSSLFLKVLVVIFGFFAAGLLFAGTAQAGGTTTVNGQLGKFVYHNSLKPPPGVSTPPPWFDFKPYKKPLPVKLQGPNGFLRNTSSDSEGRFKFSNVPISTTPYFILVPVKCPVPVAAQQVTANSTVPVSVQFGLPPCVDSPSGVASQQPPPYRGGPIPTTSASCGSSIRSFTTKNGKSVVVDLDLATVQRTLLGVNGDGQGNIYLHFDTTDLAIRALQPKQVLFLEHLGAGKVSQVSYGNNEINVHLTPAKLADFIGDGTLAFPPSTGCTPAKNAPAVTQWVMSKGGATATGGHFYWTYSAGATGGSTTHYHFVAYKKAPRFDGSVTADGTLESTTPGHGLILNAVIVPGEIRKFEFQVPLTGHLDVQWNVLQHTAGGGEPGDSRLVILPFYQEMFDIGKVPFLFQVMGNVIFTPGIGEPKAALKGAYHVKYNGTAGIQGGTYSHVGAVGNLTDSNVPTADPVVTSALAAHGAVVAVNAPKVALSFGPLSLLYAIMNQVPGQAHFDAQNEASHLELYTYQQTMFSGATPPAKFFQTNGVVYAMWVNEYDYASNGNSLLNLIPCRAEHIQMHGSVGASASFLGTMGTLKDAVLFSNTWTKLSSNSAQAKKYCGWK